MRLVDSLRAWFGPAPGSREVAVSTATVAAELRLAARNLNSALDRVKAILDEDD